MSNLTYATEPKSSIATTGIEPASTAGEHLHAGSYGLTVITLAGNVAGYPIPGCPIRRALLPSGQNVFISGNDIEFVTFPPGIATTGAAFLIDSALEDEGIRGVFTLKHRRNLIFSQEIELRIADLPRRKPRVTFDRLAFDTDD